MSTVILIINRILQLIIKYSKKIVKPTEEELKLHKEFLKKEINKNYFN